jgi:hypothetical protein
MAVEVNVTCEGYSGASASFVTQVRVVVDGETVATFNGADTQSFSGALDIEGAAVVEVFDRTAGNDYDAANGTTDHGGPGDNLHGTYLLACPVPVATMPEPVDVVEPSVNPSVSLNTPVDTSPTTSVELSTVAPSSTDYSGQDDFYVATVVAEPVGCCADYVAEVGTAATLPETGVPYLPQMLGVGSALLLLGALALRSSRRVAV